MNSFNLSQLIADLTVLADTLDNMAKSFTALINDAFSIYKGFLTMRENARSTVRHIKYEKSPFDNGIEEGDCYEQ